MQDWEIDQGSDHFQASTLSVTTIDIGNPTTNIIPGEATAHFNIRFNDLHTSKSLIKTIQTMLIDVAGADKYAMDVKVSGESFLTPPGPLSNLVVAAVEAELGLTPDLSTTGGTSDSRFIKDYCQVLDFGLVGQTMHQVNEAVTLNDLENLTRIYSRIIEGFFPPSPVKV
jgi:succinyl-diaminopimelate desuccinylase